VKALRVLFVDDEPMILGGLRNAFRKQRQVWDMEFVASGAAALEAMERQPFDVVVTDMRMPGMDGGELLEHCRGKYPSTMRIVLSGDAERDAAMRALSVAHQYLSKPCDSVVLGASIERVSCLAPLLSDPGLRSVVGALDRLPSLPRSFVALTQALASPTASIAQIAAIVANDTAMTVKILQVANSAYFGPVQQKSTLGAAIAFLGLDLVKALALTAHVFSALEGQPVSDFSLELFQRTAILAARMARRVVGNPALAEAAFSAALVHDIGQVVLALGRPDRYGEVLWLARDGGVPLHVAEEETLGVAHPAIGAYLLGVWGLPLGIVELTALHHGPAPGDAEGRQLMAAVQVATALAGEALGGEATRYAGALEAEHLAHLAGPVDLEGLRAEARAEAALPTAGLQAP
jgi:HD-like signal output (HDOD) protein